MVFAHGGEFHPIQLVVMLGMMFVPAIGILVAVLVAGRRAPATVATERDHNRTWRDRGEARRARGE